MGAIQIIQIWDSSFFRLACHGIFVGYQLSNLGIGFIQIPGNDSFYGANDNAGRLVAAIKPVDAVVALGRRICIGVNVKGIVGTGLHATLAADAAVIVKIHNAVSPGVKCCCGTNFNARCIRTMIAAMDRKFPSAIWENTFLNIFNMSSIYTKGNIMFRLTRNRTGMAANALTIIYDKSVIHTIFFVSQYRTLLRIHFFQDP
jgi:hypothetical protein